MTNDQGDSNYLRVVKAFYYCIWFLNLLLILFFMISPVGFTFILVYLLLTCLIIEFIKAVLLYAMRLPTNIGLTGVITNLIKGKSTDTQLKQKEQQRDTGIFYILFMILAGLVLIGLIFKGFLEINQYLRLIP
jgi:hypothetical protein